MRHICKPNAPDSACEENKQIEEILSLCEDIYRVIDEGASRRVFLLNEDWVLKVPICCYWIRANLAEYIASRNPENNIAETHLVYVYDIPLVKMEYVTSAPEHYSINLFPLEIDCCQVGLNKNRDVVAYDAGDHVKLLTPETLQMIDRLKLEQKCF